MPSSAMYDRLNLEAARIIMRDPGAEGLRLEWAQRFMSRWARENPEDKEFQQPPRGDGSGRLKAQRVLPLEGR